MTTSIPLFEGQGWLQIGEILLAFVLSSLIGLERQLRGKSAGLRTQAIVGTASALFLLVSKYGFMDVLSEHVTLDPSRVAAQVVTGIGFLGAGLILTRRGAVHGLTTAASVWETAAIGMAAGAGLWLLAIVVTALHFIIVYGLSALIRVLPRGRESQLELEVVYRDGEGLLRSVLAAITHGGWAVSRTEPHPAPEGAAAVTLELTGAENAADLMQRLSGIEGVHSVQLISSDELE